MLRPFPPHLMNDDDEEEDEPREDRRHDDEGGGELGMPAGDRIAKLYFKSRTVIVAGTINDKLAQRTVSHLLALAEDSDKPINMLISSPGGHVESGDMIHDVIKFIRPTVRTIGSGGPKTLTCSRWAASRASSALSTISGPMPFGSPTDSAIRRLTQAPPPAAAVR